MSSWLQHVGESQMAVVHDFWKFFVSANIHCHMQITQSTNNKQLKITNKRLHCFSTEWQKNDRIIIVTYGSRRSNLLPHHLLKYARGNAQEREGTERKEHSERPNLAKLKNPEHLEGGTDSNWRETEVPEQSVLRTWSLSKKTRQGGGEKRENRERQITWRQKQKIR